MEPALYALLALVERDPTPYYKQFRQATTAGNEAYAVGELEQARCRFADALKLARGIVLRAANGIGGASHAAATLLLAHRNAAQALLRSGEIEAAGYQLNAAYRQLSAWHSSGHAPDDLVEACAALMSDACAACAAHQERYGGPSDSTACTPDFQHIIEP